MPTIKNTMGFRNVPVQTPFGTVAFLNDGTAEVTDEQAEHLLGLPGYEDPNAEPEQHTETVTNAPGAEAPQGNGEPPQGDGEQPQGTGGEAPQGNGEPPQDAAAPAADPKKAPAKAAAPKAKAEGAK